MDRFKLGRKFFLQTYAARGADSKLLPGEVWDESKKATLFPRYAQDLQPFVWKPKVPARTLVDQATWLADFCSRSAPVRHSVTDSCSLG